MELRSIGKLFGITHCTACVIFHGTCAAIVKVLLTLYIIFPKGERVTDTVDGIFKMWGIP